ncbi:hypothetical protein AK88_02569 [Plasmodium fragile]|uniref:Uncharacterized protein n=1 Tax=Plasmodium fragile TaxID=5857 RepID=A0A0D9QLZ3_PLAFR|nr:uncharacterized protein AK88_02568 [Plasmodium fragile]XP_012335617.1 uncharacterized protein AK88_02569 [Plasmodium fragile]KJP87812.1 hypothetical protein AK88_02568 [Plasmodium fragile]KJP87813.1 hypothetical protein AK88_02569 [Plasmodium fragile]
MKVESNNSDVSDPFAASQIIGDKLLQGWTLLNECCHMCMVTPLIKQKNKEERFCAKCNVYIVSEKPDGDELVTKGSSNMDGKKNVEGECQRDVHLEGSQNLTSGTNNANVEADTCVSAEKQPYPDSYADPIFEEKMSPIEFIKEIKLQHDEFNQILNKNKITKEETENLIEYKKYIKERCGYELGAWMNSNGNGLNGIQMSNKKESQKKATSLANKDMDMDPDVEDKKQDKFPHEGKKNHQGHKQGHSSQKREYVSDSTQRRPDLIISKENYFPSGRIDFNKYTNYKVDFMILDNAKDAFMQKLDKYVKQLSSCDSKSDENEYIGQVAIVVDVLERLNNLRRNIHIVI